MARHRRHRSSGFGMNGMIKAVALGAVGGAIAPKIPVVSTVPYSRAVGGALFTYALGGKSMKKMLIGAAAGQFLGGTLGGAVGQATGTTW